MSALIDIRKKKLEQWASFYLGCMVKGTEASSDASFRRYFRFQNGAQNLVAMDAPPESEDCRPFVAVAKMLAKAGVNVPDILQEDIGRGFLLLSDLGMETVVLGPGSIDQAHQPNEFLALDQLNPSIAILRGLIEKYCLGN